MQYIFGCTHKMINQQDLIVMNHKSTKKIYYMDDRNITSVINKNMLQQFVDIVKRKYVSKERISKKTSLVIG